jgi:hypothetical protein
MNADVFTPFSQYEDLQGSVAADRADLDSAEHWLENQGLVNEGEHLAGIRASVCPSSEGNDSYVLVNFLLIPNETNLRRRTPGVNDPPPIVVRQLQREMKLGDFFLFFKQFEFTLSS